MGLFDRFKRKVKQAAEEVDVDALLADEESEEGKEAVLSRENIESGKPAEVVETSSPIINKDDDWDDWDDLEEITPPQKRKKKTKKAEPAKKPTQPAGSKVDLQMMRTTTGRQLIEVKSSPKGSLGATESDSGIAMDFGGGVVESGGKIIKQSTQLDNFIEELEWILLESDVSSDAVSNVISALKGGLIGQRLRRGADITKVIEASLKRAISSLLSAGYWDFDDTIQHYIDQEDLPIVIMFVGVNGTGKTTSVAKVAHRLLGSGYSVLAAAADTFRAGAIEQLETHCERLGIRCDRFKPKRGRFRSDCSRRNRFCKGEGY